MTYNELIAIEIALVKARTSSGYAQSSSWAIENGIALMNEIIRLRQIVRINALKAGATHADVDVVLDGERNSGCTACAQEVVDGATACAEDARY